MRDFNEIKKALWLFKSPNYSFINKTFAYTIPEDEVHSLNELCYRYRTEPNEYGESAYIGIRTRHRSPAVAGDTDSGSIIAQGLQALINDKCNRAANFTDVYHFKSKETTNTFKCKITYKLLRHCGYSARLNFVYENGYYRASSGATAQLGQSGDAGIYTSEYKFQNPSGAYTGNDFYISFEKTYKYPDMDKYIDFIEFVSIEPGDGWEWADKKEEKVLHKFSYVVNISSNPAVLKVYAKNDAIEKCSLDADKYVDTDLNKVVYTVTYANGSTATIDYWSYDENEELVVYQNMNCTLGERIQSW